MTPSGPSTVGEIMTTRVVAATPATSYKRLIEAMRTERIGCLPVTDEHGHVLGMITESDLFRFLADRDGHHGTRRRRPVGRSTPSAGQLMSAPAVTVPTSEPLADAATTALRTGVHRLPVVDQVGRLVGLVSRADLLRVYLRPDNAIRDEILERVVHREFALDPFQVDVRVERGIVHIRGQVERPVVARELLTEIDAVAGVIAVDSELSSPRRRTGTVPAE